MFYNQGKLYGDITIKDLLSNNYNSKARNKLIARAFKEAGIIEKYGSGINRIFELCKNHGVIAPVLEEFQGGFRVMLFKEKIENISAKDLEKDLENNEILSKNQQEILNAISRNNRITQKELSALVGINEKNIRNNIAILKNKGVVRRIGPDKGGYWELILTN